LYNAFRDDLKEAMYLYAQTKEKGAWMNILAKFTRLRLLSISPYTALCGNIEKCEKYRWCEDEAGEGGAESCKIKKIVELVKSFKEGEKYVIFSTFRGALDLIEKTITTKTHHVVKHVYGGMSGHERDSNISSFKDDPDVNGLLLTYGVGSEGLNLAKSCSKVIMVEPWWNEAVHNQAKSRVWRLGQTSQVDVYYLLTEDTIEQKVLNIAKTKTANANSFMFDDETIEKVTTTKNFSERDLYEIMW
jgi:SNF2 family DNA or RNA helicase